MAWNQITQGPDEYCAVNLSSPNRLNHQCVILTVCSSEIIRVSLRRPDRMHAHASLSASLQTLRSSCMASLRPTSPKHNLSSLVVSTRQACTVLVCGERALVYMVVTPRRNVRLLVIYFEPIYCDNNGAAAACASLVASSQNSMNLSLYSVPFEFSKGKTGHDV